MEQPGTSQPAPAPRGRLRIRVQRSCLSKRFWHLFLTVLFHPKTSPTFQYNLDYNIYLGEIMCVGRVWCPTKAELRPRPAAAWSTPRPLKMSTKFREIVLKPKIHRHLYSNNRGSFTEPLWATSGYNVFFWFYRLQFFWWAVLLMYLKIHQDMTHIITDKKS